MNDKVKISVGMPTFNGEAHIAQAIEDILCQSFSNLELVVSDNASTDGTEDICRDFVKRDPRVRYHRNDKNIGASDNYNIVFTRSVGEYFKWASSNDYCKPSFLESCMDQFETRADAVLCFPKTRTFVGDPDNFENCTEDLDIQSENVRERWEQLFAQLHLNNIMNGVFKSVALRKTALIKPYYGSDVVLMAEILLHGKFCQVPEYLFYRRMDDESATKYKSEEEVLKHYDPDMTKLMLFQHWIRYYEYWAAVRRAPLPIQDKSSLTLLVAKQALWHRRELLRDFILAGKWLRKKAFPATAT